MNRDDIIKMAQEAGWKDLRECDSEMREDIFMGKTQDLERFAALVAAAEREECAKVCEVLTPTDINGVCPVADAIRARGNQNDLHG